MPKIEVPQPKIRPTTELAGQQQPIPTGLFDEQFAAGRGLARAVGQGAQVVGDIAINTLRAQGDEEFTKAKLDYETRFRSFQQELLTDTNYAGFTKKFDAWHTDTVAQLTKQINHRGAQSRAANQFKLNKAVRGKTIDTNAQNSLVRQTRATLPDKIDSFVTEELQADTPETLKKAVAERKAYFQTLIETGVVNPIEAESLEKDYQEAKGRRILENTVTAIAVELGWDAAVKFLNDPKQVKELVDIFGLELADIDKILEDVKTQANLSRAEGKQELEDQRQTDSQAILNRILNNDLVNIDEFINATKLAPTGANSKTTWMDRANKRATAIINNKKIITDEQVRAELEEMANDIDIGSVTKEQVLTAANEARYTDETIDGTAYRQIRSLIDTEHKSYQSTAIKEGVSFGAGQLVSVTQSVLDTLLAADVEIDIKAATKRRELELWNHGQYRKALNDWLTVNPEANSDEIYIQSRKLVTQYRRSITEIERARADFEQRLKSGVPIPPGRVSALFPNPIIVESPFGTQNWTSQEQFDKILKPLGYKKVGMDAAEEQNRRGGNLRPDGTQKGTGFLGVLQIEGDNTTSEFSVQSDAVKVNGKRIDFPTLVSTLTQAEIDLMVNDIIPNRKAIPEAIMQKAIKHAKKRLKEGKSVFFEEGENR